MGDALVGAPVAWLLFLTVVLAPHAGLPVLLLLFATGAGSFNLVLSL